MLNRQIDMNKINRYFAILSSSVEIDAKVHLFDIHTHAEMFFKDLLNLVLDYDLVNINLENMNAEAIDLVDESKKILIQVSSRNDKSKIQTESLDKIDNKKYNGYSFKYVCISRNCSNLKDKDYNLPQGISFSPKKDILDMAELYKYIENCSLDKVKTILNFLSKEIEIPETGIMRPKAITYIINELAKINLNDSSPIGNTKAFEIENKISFNSLNKWRAYISEYAIYSAQVDDVYHEYDKIGNNKSRAVLAYMHDLYIELHDSFSGDNLFDELVKKVYTDIDGDNSCNENLLQEDLILNIKIVLVDAFTKCKIFERPI